jgi:hypothetical protein
MLKKLEALKKSNPEIAELFAELIQDKELAESKAAKAQQIAMDAATSLELAKAKQALASPEERNVARQVAAKQLASAREATMSVSGELAKQKAQKQIKVTVNEARDQDVYEGKLKDGLSISINGVRWFMPQDVEVEVPESVALWLKDREAEIKQNKFNDMLLRRQTEYNEVNLGWHK